jgi:curved DNA-binding protein
MEYRDYYETLGISRNAEAAEIRRAYRSLARQYHPDLNPNNKEAEERFKALNEAYEVLSDPEKRKKYDQFGRDWQRYQQAPGAGDFDWSRWQQQPGGAGSTYTYTTAEDVEDLFGAEQGFSDFFESLFGRGRPQAGQARARPQRGQDLEHPVEVTLREAFTGTTRLMTKDGRQLEVRIPPGVRTGSRVRMSGEGAPGRGAGEAGDLYLVVDVLPDPQFERAGDDLTTDVEVPLYTATLGGEVAVPTLGGTVKLSVPAGTQNGRRFRLRGRGMPQLRQPENYGDLYAVVRVRLPEHLNDEERALFEQLRAIRQGG